MTDQEPERLPSIRVLSEGGVLSEREEDEMFVDGLTLIAGFMVSTFRRSARRKQEQRERRERDAATWEAWDEADRPWPPPGISAKAPEPPEWNDRRWTWQKPYHLS